MSAVRRSTRRRVPNQRFTEDASALLDDLDSNPAVEDQDEDQDEHIDHPTPEVEDDAESASEEALEGRNAEAASSESSADESEGSNQSDEPTRQLRQKQTTKRRALAKGENTQHVRGLSVSTSSSKRMLNVVKLLAGSDKNEQQRLKKTIDFWYDESCFPSRNRILQAVADDAVRVDLASGGSTQGDDPWAWYEHAEVEAASNSIQRAHRISSSEARKFYPNRLPVHKVVMGPHWHQTLFELKLHQPLHLAATWTPARDATQEDPMDDSMSSLERNGWIISLGAKIQSLAWAPNRDHDTQFLAVALDHPDPFHLPSQTAFDPTNGYKSSVQIWMFKAQQNDSIPKGLDPNIPPILAHLVCTEWGMCNEIKWCPIPRQKDTSDEHKSSLGLMATIWSDGYVRVLDITNSMATDTRGACVKYNDAIFTSKPPQSICTTLTWASSRDLIAGCADGRIVIWDISQHINDRRGSARFRNSNADEPEASGELKTDSPPYFTCQSHDSYITGAQTCLPLYPHLLITVSTDGYYRFSDLRTPEFDTVESHRYRVFPSAFDYCPHFNAAVAADALDGAHFLWLRRFFAEQELAFCDGHIEAVACGRAHPFALLGSADGSVLVVNTASRVVKERGTRRKFELMWFRHEWRPESTSDTQAPSSAPRAGISRITEAFKPRLRLKKNADKGRAKSVRDTGAASWETLHEEPSAVTQVAWNPVPFCGGWAAAGMGSGLLRVEDLAVG